MADFGITGFVNDLIQAGDINKYAKLLESLQLQMPQSMGEAQGLVESQANSGLPNYQQAQENIQESIPTTLNQVKDYFDSNKIPQLLSSMYTKSLGQQQNLDTQQASALLSGKKNLSDFMQGKSQYQTQLEQYNNQLQAGAAQEKMKANQKAYGAVDTFLSLDFASGILGGSDNSSALSSLFTPSQKQVQPSTGGGTDTSDQGGTYDQAMNYNSQGNGGMLSGLLGSLLTAII